MMSLDWPGEGKGSRGRRERSWNEYGDGVREMKLNGRKMSLRERFERGGRSKRGMIDIVGISG
jgi:hypothetical protein